MADLVGQVDWDKFKAIQREAHDTFAQKEITWKRSRGGLDYNGGDIESERFTDITLKVLIGYNAFRTWPVNRPLDIGEQDKENSYILINLQYLGELNYLDVNGRFAFNPAMDRFIIDGFNCKAMGDTPTSQAFDDPLWQMIIVKREELITGT